MHPRRVLFLGMTSVLLLTGGVAAGAQQGELPTDPVSAAQIGAEAYQYGVPLLQFLRVRREMSSVNCPDELGNAPVNAFSHVAAFPDATFRTVVAPNTETLYSIALLDLSAGPLLVQHPNMGHRYYSFAMLDPYTNLIATPGAREDGFGAGSIVIRQPGQDISRAPRNARVVTTPYQRVWIIGRTLAGDSRDQRSTHILMTRYQLTDLAGRSPQFPAGCTPGTAKKYPVPTDAKSFLAALNTGLKNNPPPVRDSSLLTRLRPYGIGAGLDPERSGLNPATLNALYQAVATKASTLPQEAKASVLIGAEQSRGWYTPQSDIGDYGTDYQFRSYIALVGLGANTPDEATYPVGLSDANGVLYEMPPAVSALLVCEKAATACFPVSCNGYAQNVGNRAGTAAVIGEGQLVEVLMLTPS